jgi:hypothetical protein
MASGCMTFASFGAGASLGLPIIGTSSDRFFDFLISEKSKIGAMAARRRRHAPVAAAHSSSGAPRPGGRRRESTAAAGVAPNSIVRKTVVIGASYAGSAFLSETLTPPRHGSPDPSAKASRSRRRQSHSEFSPIRFVGHIERAPPSLARSCSLAFSSSMPATAPSGAISIMISSLILMVRPAPQPGASGYRPRSGANYR